MERLLPNLEEAALSLGIGRMAANTEEDPLLTPL
jgi:hypothetical protein